MANGIRGKARGPWIGNPSPQESTGNWLSEQLRGATETAATLGTGAAAMLAGMPYGLYKGLTSGQFMEGKAADIATKELEEFIKRNTYGPRSEAGQEQLARLGIALDPLKAPAYIPGVGPLASVPRGTIPAAGEMAKPALARAARAVGVSEQALSDVPPASFAVRPEGTRLAIRTEGTPDWVGGFIGDGVDQARFLLRNRVHSEDRAKLMEDFWTRKATNYFSRQFGTESDPVYRGIREQTIQSPVLTKDFPNYVLDQLSVGKTRVNPETGQTQFFPKYPAASDAMRQKYDELTNISGAVLERDPKRVMDLDFTYLKSPRGERATEALRDVEIDRMIAQGTSASQALPNIDFVTRSLKDPSVIVGPSIAKSLLKDYETATGTRIGDPEFRGVPQPEALPQNLRMAAEKGEVVYGTPGPSSPLNKLFDVRAINEYLADIPERELRNIRFEDAVKGGAKVSSQRMARETLEADIKAGKRVSDRFFSEGVSAPLLQFNEGPLAGFAWKRIENAEATVPEGAYVGHSVGGYAKGGGYGPEKHKMFNEGKMQVFTLRDNRNRPVNTIEVRMEDRGPVVTQIKGNGRATGNTAPENYDQAVLQFLQDYLKPVRINESKTYLTPVLEAYQRALE
jgi:hypothetical protein